MILSWRKVSENCFKTCIYLFESFFFFFRIEKNDSCLSIITLLHQNITRTLWLYYLMKNYLLRSFTFSFFCILVMISLNISRDCIKWINIVQSRMSWLRISRSWQYCIILYYIKWLVVTTKCFFSTHPS